MTVHDALVTFSRRGIVGYFDPTPRTIQWHVWDRLGGIGRIAQHFSPVYSWDVPR